MDGIVGDRGANEKGADEKGADEPGQGGGAGGERGAATAEYAIVTLAAVAFAGLLVAILRSEEVRTLLLGLVQRALSLGG